MLVGFAFSVPESPTCCDGSYRVGSVHPDMEAAEKALDYLEQQIPSLSAAAVDVAYWHALANGQNVLVSGDGGIYRMFPDGTWTLVKTTSAPLSVPVGTKVRIP